jgi:hypothetical protein
VTRPGYLASRSYERNLQFLLTLGDGAALKENSQPLFVL